MPTPMPALSQQVVWKNAEVRGFAVALVKHALRSGAASFTTDIVPDDERGSGATRGPGIAGTVTCLLKNANVIEPVGIVQDGRFYADRRKSERREAKDRWLNVYRLKSEASAKEFLARNKIEFEERQLELVG